MIAWLRRFPSILPLALLLIVVLTSCTTIRRDELDREAPPGPGQAARLLRMGTDALAAGDPATAAALFARVLVLEPGNREAARRLGEAALRSGRYEEAIEAYRRLVDSDVNDVEAARGMAKALLALGRPEAALARLSRLCRRSRRTRGCSISLASRSTNSAGTKRHKRAIAPRLRARPKMRRCATTSACRCCSRGAMRRRSENWRVLREAHRVRRGRATISPPPMRSRAIRRQRRSCCASTSRRARSAIISPSIRHLEGWVRALRCARRALCSPSVPSVAP